MNSSETHRHDRMMGDVVKIHHIKALQKDEGECFEEIRELAHVINPAGPRNLSQKKRFKINRP